MGLPPPRGSCATSLGPRGAIVLSISLDEREHRGRQQPHFKMVDPLHEAVPGLAVADLERLLGHDRPDPEISGEHVDRDAGLLATGSGPGNSGRREW